MSFISKCPHCQQELEIDEEWIGQTCQCPTCNQEFTVAGPKKVQQPAAQPQIQLQHQQPENFFVNCPHCQQQFSVSSEWSGKTCKCSVCNQDFVIPSQQLQPSQTAQIQPQVQLRPAEQSQPQVQAQPQIQLRPAEQPQPQIQVQPQIQLRPAEQPQPQVQPQLQIQLRPAEQPQSQVQAQPQIQLRPATQPQPQVQPQPQIQLRPAEQPQPQIQAQPQIQLRPTEQPQPQIQAQPQIQLRPAEQPQPQVQSQSQFSYTNMQNNGFLSIMPFGNGKFSVTGDYYTLFSCVHQVFQDCQSSIQLENPVQGKIVGKYKYGPSFTGIAVTAIFYLNGNSIMLEISANLADTLDTLGVCSKKVTEFSNRFTAIASSFRPAVARPNGFPMTPPDFAQRAGESYEGKAKTALYCGLGGLLVGILGILAIIFGAVALNGMTTSHNEEGKNFAIAGLILGIVDVVGWLLIIF